MFVKVMSPPEVKLEAAVPVMVNAPFCVIAPVELMVKPPDTLEAPSSVAMPFVKEAELPDPVVLKEAAPMIPLPILVKVMGFALAAKLAVPGTVKAPVWVIAPVVFTDKLFPTLDAPNTNAPASTVSVPEPVSVKKTAPVKALDWFKLML